MSIVVLILSLLVSTASLVIVWKERSRRSYAGDLEEFRAETERLIAEFNRVAERNMGILDDRLDHLEKTQLRARKAEEALKALLEEALRNELLNQGEARESSTLLSHPKEAFAYGKEEPPPQEEPQSEGLLFDGFALSRLKSYAKHRNQPKQKHELLRQYLRENKKREELLEMGFSPNEINLALLSLGSDEKS